MKVLDDVKGIKKIDKSDMMRLIMDFPGQCRDAFEIGKSFSVPQSYLNRVYKNIVFSGLGGSAIGADLLRSYLCGEIKIPIFVSRDYTLPNFVDQDTLFFACSYSGDTEETLSSYAEAKRRGATILAVSSGGKLEVLVKQDNVPFLSIPKGYPPRAALGYAFFPWLAVLRTFGFISDKSSDVEDAVSNMEDIRDKSLNPVIKTAKNPAKKLAESLKGKYAIIYAANKHFDSVITRFRGQMAENSKSLSSTHVFPEMNHNETVGWENPRKLLKDFVVLFLRDESEHPRVAKRMQITAGIIRKKSKVIEIPSKGRSLLSRMFYLIYTGDFTSYYLAILNRRDPTPVEMVTYLKGELAKFK